MKIKFWKLWKNRWAVTGIWHDGEALLKAADVDKDGDIDTDDLKHWLDDETVGLALLDVVIGVVRLVRVFTDEESG